VGQQITGVDVQPLLGCSSRQISQFGQAVIVVDMVEAKRPLTQRRPSLAGVDTFDA
jgi:hypothetical protein